MTTRLGDLGTRLRAARLGRGLSLRATAGAANVSPSLLSQVETGKVQPSVSTLYSIVTILDLSLDELLGVAEHQTPPKEVQMQHAEESPVLPAGDGISLLMEGGVLWERLASHNPRVSPILVTYSPGGASSIDDTHLNHVGVEYAYLIEGELTLKLGSETHLLRAGDSLCFDSRRPHLYSNHTNGITRGVWFVLGQEHAAAQGGPTEVRSAVDALGELNRQNFSS